MKKKLLGLALGLSALASVQMYQNATAQVAVGGVTLPTDVSQLSPETLKNVAAQLRGELAKHMPIIQNFIKRVSEGKFDALAEELKAQSANLDVNAVLNFLASHVGQFKALMTKALEKVPSDLSAFPVPAEVKEKLPQAVQMVRNNLDKFDRIPALLNQVRPMINLSANIDFLIANLKKASTSEQFKAFVPQLQSLGADLQTSWQEFQGVDFSLIANAVQAVKNQQQGQPFNLIDLIRGIGLARRLAPHLLNIVNKVMSLAIDLDNVVQQSGVTAKLPTELQTALDAIRSHAGSLQGFISKANDYIDQMKAAMPIPPGMMAQ